MSSVSGKLHYSFGDGSKTLCGRVLTPKIRVTPDPRRVTCDPCRHSSHLDGQLGNMTHTGH